MLLFVGFVSVDVKADFTVATFADPSGNSNNPLFTVDFTSLTLDGNWPDTKTNLTLQIYDNNFPNAWFTMNEVTILSSIVPGTYLTGPGEIRFYKDNTNTNPLIVIDFNNGTVSQINFGAGSEFNAENVTITGSQIIGSLSQESFSFSFANTAILPGGHSGFTATAAFTSSAVPEPATFCLLGLGALSLVSRKKRLKPKKTTSTSIKKHYLILILLAFLSVGFISVNTKAVPPSFTVATFADPSPNSNNRLFTVDFNNMKLNGGWSDSQNGLTLQIPYNGHLFQNAWFDMNDVTITSKTLTPWGPFGQTGQGEIRFYADTNSISPLVVIDFNGALVSPYGFGANEVLFTAANVAITGSEITGILSQEQFAFSFANLAHLQGSTNWNDGFTATAAFTSSAIPEPATIALLAIGSLLFRKKK